LSDRNELSCWFDFCLVEFVACSIILILVKKPIKLLNLIFLFIRQRYKHAINRQSMQPVPNQPTQYNPNIGYTPSAPVQPAPQYNPNIAPPQPLPTVNQQYHQPLAHKQGLLQNSEKGTFANMKILSVAICILLMGSGFGIG